MPLPINFNAVLSELLAQFLFVFICASAASAPIADRRARQPARARRGDAAGRAGPPRRAAPRRPPGARPGALTERAARTRRAAFLEGSTSPRAQRRHGLRHGVAGTPGWVQQVSLTFG